MQQIDELTARIPTTSTKEPQLQPLVLLDVALAPELKEHPRVTVIEGNLPEAMASVPDRSLDVVVCNSVLEHLWEPLTALCEFHRVLGPAGTLLVNVPSWRGKPRNW